MRIFIYFFYQWQLLRRKINFKLACRRANGYRDLTGKQYFVIQTSKVNYTCISNDDKEFYSKQAKKLGMRKFDYLHICKIAAYKTKQGSLTR